MERLNRRDFLAWTGSAALGLVVLAACGPAPETKRIRIDGSSTVFPITEAVAEEFIKKYPDVQVTVGVSGTGGGFNRFCAGETDLNDASRPISESEKTACLSNNVSHLEFPVAYDGITVVVNPENSWAKYITVSELKKIWQPEAQNVITNWNQVRPDVWPDVKLELFGPGTDSGTFDYFTEVIVGKAKSSRGDYTASEDDNALVRGVSATKGALGYFGFSYYKENMDKLMALRVDAENEYGPILPSEETIRNGLYKPLSRPLFLYLSAGGLKDKAHLVEFMRFYFTEGPALVTEVGFVAMPEDAYADNLARLQEVHN